MPVPCGEGVDDCCMAIDDDFLLGRPLGVLRFDCFLRTMQQMTMTEMTMHNRPAAAPIAISVMGRANGGGSIGSCAVGAIVSPAVLAVTSAVDAPALTSVVAPNTVVLSLVAKTTQLATLEYYYEAQPHTS